MAIDHLSVVDPEVRTEGSTFKKGGPVLFQLKKILKNKSVSFPSVFIRLFFYFLVPNLDSFENFKALPMFFVGEKVNEIKLMR